MLRPNKRTTNEHEFSRMKHCSSFPNACVGGSVGNPPDICGHVFDYASCIMHLAYLSQEAIPKCTIPAILKCATPAIPKGATPVIFKCATPVIPECLYRESIGVADG